MKKVLAHMLSASLILGMLGVGLPAVGAVSPQKAYAAAQGIKSAAKGETVNLGPTMAPDGFNCAGAASQWVVLDVQDADGNSTTDAGKAARILMITKDVWMSYDDATGEDLGVTFADLDTWCNSFYSDVLKSDARVASVDGKHAFVLSREQVNDTNLFADNNARKASDIWWTSTNIGTSNAWVVNADGSIGAKQMTNEYTVRPVVYLDTDKVVCSRYFKGWSLYDTHSFGKWTKKDDKTHQRTCSRDGAVEEEDHTWDDGVVADGIKTYTCTACNATRTETVSDPLADAKAAAREELEGIDLNQYSGDEKAAAEKAIVDGLAAIEAAETVDAVNAAANTAKDTIAVLKTNAAKAEDAAAAAETAKTAAQTAKETADASSAAAEEAAKTPGQEAVDAAKKAKADAEAAKEAADAYKEAADAAAAAAELAYGAEDDKTKAAKQAAEEAATAAEKAAQAVTDADAAVSAAEQAKKDKEAAEAQAGKDAKSAADAKAAAEAKAKADAEKLARDGVPDKKIPKVKISKPSVKKNTITVKWKKLSKKQFKKSKAKKYEIWVCPNKGFAKDATKEKIVKKSKKSYKFKGLKKKTRYYVKVRAIKYKGGTKYVGKWSKVKSIKTK